MSVLLLALVACDKEVEEGLTCTVTTTYWKDEDGDGFGDEDNEVEACKQADGLVLNDEDCDDSNPEIHPDADEVCDENDVDEDCDRDRDDEDNGVEEDGYRSWFEDDDDDGFPDLDSKPVEACDEPVDGNYARGQEDDCDDGDETVNPDATEICDGQDNNCDGFADDQDIHLDTSTAEVWFLDGDGDGYAADDAPTTQACTQPAGYTAERGDCDDFEASVRPGATETCNGVDDDCDGELDPDEVDGDGDGYATCEGDIDDTDPEVTWLVESYAVGGDAEEYSYEGRFRGLMYEAGADVRLHGFDMRLGLASTCDLDAYVLHAETDEGPFDVAWYGTVSAAPGIGYVESGDVGPLELVEGDFYVLGFGFPCEVSAYADFTEDVGNDFGVGTLVGLLYDNSYESYNFADALTATSPIFDMVNHVSEVE